MNYPGKIRIIGGKWRGRKVPVLSMETLRPTPDRIRETLFNWLQPMIVDAKCVDLFAGTGILGFEALSRGAQEVLMIDKSREAINTLTTMANTLKIEGDNIKILNQDVIHWLKSAKPSSPYDVLFLDPPFESDLLEQAVALLNNSPIIGPNTLIYIEVPASSTTIPAPDGWVPIKSKTAAKVGYHLLAYQEPV